MNRSKPDLLDPATVKGILNRHSFRLKKSLGQHLLVDPSVADEVIGAAKPENEDVLEIGPGIGTLSVLLAPLARRLVMVEAATRFEPILDEVLGGRDNAEIIMGDFLSLDVSVLDPPEDGFVVASNLPYSISTPALFRFLGGGIPFKRIAVTVQWEVAERLVAKPGTKAYGALSVGAGAHAEIEILRRVDSSSFMPRPRVSSAVVLLTPRPGPLPPDNLREVTRAAFSGRRKKLVNSLSSAAGGRSGAGDLILAAGLDPGMRPDAVPIDGYISLARGLMDMNAGNTIEA